MEEGAGVIFSIYDSAKLKVDELSGENKGGKAEAECVYHYEHDPENPLTEKPQFTFKAKALRAEEVESGTVEIEANITLSLLDEQGKGIPQIKYTLYSPDGTTIEGTTDDTGKIMHNNVIPCPYTLVFRKKES